ncbi:GntR family transcriptional regulator [Brevirhabdus pacifica]|uniref:GntR family transcriptional regulator n=1 Tax=Brevirhabdus pacifica TaxID=1267768 RepID=A0A1U7DKA0_9RHOB|nr:GntR family transcriptional regulator [Brevirhabdus pacifica]APX90309.1 GntR family transcriptional regulator [Brevirhabdus pacifica]OWU78648.1 GntR family transcriptional regulator [Loktanella sp. 22II-4b]PJJ80760.1 GntR family transcriptional regulator [Brevirhabdus pacifica]
MKLKPIATKFTLKDHIYDLLRDAIVEMNIYEEGANLRLDERSLADQLGISRTPLREALVRLQQDGFVDIQARKGVFVLRKTLDEILEMIVAWAALESMAARLAATDASDADLGKLRKHAMRHSASAARADLAEYSDANIQFHELILEMSGCSLLKTMADGLFVHIHAVRRRALEEGDRATRSVVDHMSIIEALEARDAELASQLVRDHTMRLHAHVRRAWSRIETQARNRST